MTDAGNDNTPPASKAEGQNDNELKIWAWEACVSTKWLVSVKKKFFFHSTNNPVYDVSKLPLMVFSHSMWSDVEIALLISMGTVEDRCHTYETPDKPDKIYIRKIIFALYFPIFGRNQCKSMKFDKGILLIKCTRALFGTKSARSWLCQGPPLPTVKS